MRELIELPVLTCGRCGGQWIPRKPQMPQRCAKCNSPLWNKPRVRKIREKRGNKHEG